ncbi:MAG: 3',5'-cyclic-nucleotide phosphodiesterase [Thiohalomonadales bacterium]
MIVRILGCSGGVGGNLRTTSTLIDDDILIDAGSGVGDMTLDQMRKIRTIFLTHSHMDHFAFLPLLVDSIFESIQHPIEIYLQPETKLALETHIFNWTIWPNFAELPSKDRPVMRFNEMLPGTDMEINGRKIEMIGVNHIVPGVGYRISSESGSVAISGDSSTQDGFWQHLNAQNSLDLLIVEAAFSNNDLELSQKAGHYTPATLATDMKKLALNPKVYISHTKPGQEQLIVDQCKAEMPERDINRLYGGESFTL